MASVNTWVEQDKDTVTEAVDTPIGWRFVSPDKLHVFQARLNGFTFSRLPPYVDWESFRTEARRLWDLYRAVANPIAPTRIAVRYINRLDLPLPIVAIGPWHFPVALALNAVANGAAFAAWPLMWIVFNALLLYNISVRSGRFDAFRDWILESLPGDRRIILMVIGFSFSALLEGIAGFGTPIAISSSLLIMVGFPALDALMFTLIFNTAPVAFAALGVPITVLGAVTHLSPNALAAMVGRQLQLFSLLLPFCSTPRGMTKPCRNCCGSASPVPGGRT
jgi:hypothetical protein